MLNSRCSYIIRKMIEEFNLHYIRTTFILTQILMVLLRSSTTVGYNNEEVCLFPEHWYGKWFQSGVQQSIMIHNSFLSTKGHCLFSKGDKYLLRDDNNCYRCVVIHEKHVNVLQYKETYCQGKDTILNLCRLITGDALLYSMFREDSIPVNCPWKGAFTFTYNRGHGECMNPVSNIESCTQESRLILSYQACPDVYGTESAVEELECLATWNEGNARYLVGKINHRHAITNEDRYRCFVYEKISMIGDFMEYKIAQSGDATCNGLLSVTEGSRTMTLKEVAAPAKCHFPNWLANPSPWRSVDQSLFYSFYTRNFSLKVSRLKVLEIQAQCSQINRQTATDVMIILQYSEECDHGFMCMHFYRRDNYVIELQIGSRASRVEEACASKNFDPTILPFITLLSNKPNVQGCPLSSRYIAYGTLPVYNASQDIGNIPYYSHQISSAECLSDIHRLQIGCDNINAMEFKSDCSSNTDTEYLCHGFWIQNDTTFIIVSQYSSTYFCLRYTENSKKLVIGKSCHHHQAINPSIELNMSQIGQCAITNSCRVWKSSYVPLFAIIVLLNRR